jgi:cytochrome o ubiquinol oxidase operon protein cyoD
MKNHSRAKEEETIPQQGSFSAYVLGFILSFLLTLSSYFLVVKQWLTLGTLMTAIVGLGIVQTFVQLLFFLHIGSEGKPRWNLFAFLFMILVILLLVGGSMWIMFNLDDRVMPVMNTDLRLQK